MTTPTTAAAAAAAAAAAIATVAPAPTARVTRCAASRSPVNRSPTKRSRAVGAGATVAIAAAAAAAAAAAVVGVVIGGALGAFFFRDQRLPVGDRDLVIVGMDFRERQEAVAVAAVFDERRLQRRFNAGDFGEIDVTAQLLAVSGLEVEFLDPVAA